MPDENDDQDDVRAISALFTALKPLNAESRVAVLEFVIKRLGISLNVPDVPPVHNPPVALAAMPSATTFDNSPPPPPSGTRDIRTFAAEKKPKTVNEKVAVVGYYLSQLAPEGERRDHLVADDIKIFFIQADFELPSAAPHVTLANAKNAGYLSALERGQYRLNAVGHNLVAHKLPGEGGGEAKARPAARNAAKTKPQRRGRK
jgi:hypothetical protein